MYSRLICSVPILISLFCVFVYSDSNDEYTLELVQAVFRHGSRTPDPHETYPNDPYTINDYNPNVYSQLTPAGKRLAYTLGTLFRQRYKTFSGPNITENIAYAQSTDFDRTKMTLALVLSGLFPSTVTQTSSNELNWSPIPIHYNKLSKDFVIWSPMGLCPAYARELSQVLNSSEARQFFHDHAETIDYIEKHTGKNMTELRNLFYLHQTLDAEANMGLTLPEWAKEIYPEKIKMLAARILRYDNYNLRLQKLFSGRHLKVITKNMVEKSRGSLFPTDRKFFLYAGHDHNVVGPLMIFNFLPEKFPNYCSALLFELHRSTKTQEYFVKMLHVKDIASGAEEKIIPGCDLMCPLSDFIKIVEPSFPGNYTVECESDVLLE